MFKTHCACECTESLSLRSDSSCLSLKDLNKDHVSKSGMDFVSLKDSTYSYRKGANERESSIPSYKIVSSKLSNDSGSLSIVELDYDELYEEEEAKQQDTVVSISYKDVVFSISFSEPHALIAKTIMELSQRGFAGEEL